MQGIQRVDEIAKRCQGVAVRRPLHLHGAESRQSTEPSRIQAGAKGFWDLESEEA